MACTLKITEVKGFTTGGSLSSIVVNGVSEQCKSVKVTISCSEEQETLTGVLVDNTTTPGTWTATFTNPPKRCLCKGKIDVFAECDDQLESCSTQSEPGVLECVPAEPCTLKITGLEGLAVGGNLSSIVVSGTSDNCESVTVKIFCGASEETLAGVPVDTSFSPGIWKATFTSLPAECQCEGDISAFATCDDGTASCSTKTKSGLLKCSPDVEVGDCPDILGVFVTTGDCNPDGTRTVTINANLDSPGGSYSAEIRDSSGVGLGTVTGSGPQTLTGSGDYAADEIFQIIITSPGGCASLPVGAGIPLCPKCPDVSFDYDAGPCDESNNRTVDVTATLNSPDPYTAELRNDADMVLDTVSSVDATPKTLTHSESIPAGTSKTFKVVVTSPTTCGNSETEIDVPPCDCPTINIDSTIGECDDSNQRSVTVTATLDAPGTYTAELRDASDAELDSVSGSGGQTLTHTDTYPGGSEQTFTVIITDPAACGDVVETVTVPSCGNGPPSPESFGCGALRIAVAVAAAMALLAGLLAICIPAAATALGWVALGFAILAVIGGIIYAIFCPNKPCKVGLLISGQVSLGAGVAAIILSGCCAWVFGAGVGLAIVGIGLLYLWKTQCNISNCDFAKEITKVIGGIVLPLVGIIAGIAILSACINTAALASISAFFGLIAAYAVSC